MRDFAQLHTQRLARSLRPGVIAGLLVGCLLLLSACNSLSGSNVKPTLVHKGGDAIAVSTLQKEQGQLQLETFLQWIGLASQYKVGMSTYQQELLHDQKALATAHTSGIYQVALQKLNQHVNSIELSALKTEANSLEQQLAREASVWGKAHHYHDSYNGVTYQLGYEYNSNGVDGFVQDDLSSAKTATGYQQAVQDADMFLTNFQAYQADASDKTPWDKSHATNIQLMHHYNVLNQKVVVVSLGEQTARVYNNGKLVKAFQVTTGRPEKPSLPGFWRVEEKQSPTIFKSSEPPGSAYWYPDTPINYAMLYHDGGYYLHDSWWRDDYGFGTQFPHVDSSGNSFSYDGSHGCINIATPNAAWLYSYVSVNTPVIVY